MKRKPCRDGRFCNLIQRDDDRRAQDKYRKIFFKKLLFHITFF